MSCCCEQKQESDLTLLDGVLDEICSVPGSLITILQKAAGNLWVSPQDVRVILLQQTGVKPAKVFGVATFYAQFRFQPVGKYLIMLCQGTACHVNGSQMIEQAIVEELGIHDGETTSDGLFTLKDVACLGCCSLSPVMM